MMKAPKQRKRGRPPGSVPIERNPQRFEIAAWWAFVMDCDQFDAARFALLAIKGSAFSIEDLEGLLRLASADIPLPPHNPDEPDAGLRRLAAKAKRQQPSKWLIQSSGMIRALVKFVAENKWTGVRIARDELNALGWVR